MARMPDGWVVTIEADKLEVRLKETRELVMRKNCKHSYENSKSIDTACEWSSDPDFYCAAGERVVESVEDET